MRLMPMGGPLVHRLEGPGLHHLRWDGLDDP